MRAIIRPLSPAKAAAAAAPPINASLAGVFESCKNRGADIVYGMCNGVAGLLEERVVDLSTLLTDDLDIELLKRTPSSFLGSCRYKLPDWRDDEAVYKKLFAILEKLNIGYFFYIGGNDSMDTIGKLADYGLPYSSEPGRFPQSAMALPPSTLAL